MYFMLVFREKSCLSPILSWGQIGLFLEHLGEVTLLLEAHQRGDLNDRERGVEQQPLCMSDADIIHVRRK